MYQKTVINPADYFQNALHDWQGEEEKGADPEVGQNFRTITG
jgi:hypothetical protein